MAQTCKICRHVKRNDVEKAILANVPYRRIAELFQVSISALSRHKEHIPAALLGAGRAAKDAENSELVKATDRLLARMNTLERSVKRSKKRDTVQAGDLLLKISREVRALLELRERLAGPRVSASQPQTRGQTVDDDTETISEAEADQIARKWLAQRTKTSPVATESATSNVSSMGAEELSR